MDEDLRRELQVMKADLQTLRGQAERATAWTEAIEAGVAEALMRVAFNHSQPRVMLDAILAEFTAAFAATAGAGGPDAATESAGAAAIGRIRTKAAERMTESLCAGDAA